VLVEDEHFSREDPSMRRFSFVFVVVSVLALALSAAAFADTATTAPATPGWLKAQMEGSGAALISSDAQKLVGASVDQLKTEMGPSSVTSSDGRGGTYYFYQVDTASDGPNVADEWFDVDSSGKVVNAIVNAHY